MGLFEQYKDYCVNNKKPFNLEKTKPINFIQSNAILIYQSTRNQ